MPSVAASVSAVVLWISVPLVSLTTQCLLTDHCTWGETGADFGKPVTTTALHLFLVGGSLAALTALCRSRTRNDQEDRYSVGQCLFFRLQHCAAVGAAFGIKYIVGHWALRVTPNASIYELFHCFTIVWIVLWARFITGEHLKSNVEAVACLGIVIGAALTAHDSFYVETKQGGRFSLLALTLNLANGMLAGVVLALLRRTILQTRNNHVTIIEVTYWKMLIGAAFVFPLAFAVEDACYLTRQQQMWLGISSTAILVYHLNLTFLCGLAPVPVVGVIESLKPLLAVGITALLQGLPPCSKSWLFWVGSGIILVSAMSFKLSRTFPSREVGLRRELLEETPLVSQPNGADADNSEERKPLYSELRPQELP